MTGNWVHFKFVTKLETTHTLLSCQITKSPIEKLLALLLLSAISVYLELENSKCWTSCNILWISVAVVRAILLKIGSVVRSVLKLGTFVLTTRHFFNRPVMHPLNENSSCANAKSHCFGLHLEIRLNIFPRVLCTTSVVHQFVDDMLY